VTRSLDQIVAEVDPVLAENGLVTRGAFAVLAGELPHDGRAADTPKDWQAGVLVGHLGGGFWPHFSAWQQRNAEMEHPLDDWSKQVIGTAARVVGGKAVYPSDRPFLPFQRWAKRAEGLRAGPLGVLMHPLAGPWHAYRGAILFEQLFDFHAPAPQPHPCDTCADRPCLTSCPVDAISPDGFRVDACRTHLASKAGAPCMERGCLARNACPAGVDFRYSTVQQAFHQRAFRPVPDQVST
jgi:hypothetical protein